MGRGENQGNHSGGEHDHFKMTLQLHLTSPGCLAGRGYIWLQTTDRRYIIQMPISSQLSHNRIQVLLEKGTSRKC